jgi:hypothetical protein
MHMMSLVIFTFMGMALFTGVSLILFQALPPSVLQCGAHHGRFAGFGTDGPAAQSPAGNTVMTGYEALQGQSV